MSSRAYHVSKNRLGGSLSETPLTKLLESCNEHLITGAITIETADNKGRIELRAGGVDDCVYGDQQGEAALAWLKRLKEGTYELAQRLPNLNGSMGSAAECRGILADNSVIEVMRHCEAQALSCTITVVAEFERAEIIYRAGDIMDVLLNGVSNEDSLVDVVKWRHGKFRVSVPALAMNIAGWPTTSREPTVPFSIADMAKMPPKRTTPAVKPAPAPTKPALAGLPPAVPLFTKSAKPAKPAKSAKPAKLPERQPIAARQSFHHEPRLDPSGQLTLRAETLLEPTSGGAGSTFGLVAVALVLAALWVSVAVMIDAF